MEHQSDPSVEQPWLKYYDRKVMDAPLPECTVYEAVRGKNQDQLEKTALKYRGYRISYKTLFQQVEQTTKAFKCVGIQRGDCIGLCTTFLPEAVYTVLACSRIGAQVCLINPIEALWQGIAFLNQTKAVFIILPDTIESLIRETLERNCTRPLLIVSQRDSGSPLRGYFEEMKNSLYSAFQGTDKKDDINTRWRRFIERGKRYGGPLDEPYQREQPVLMVCNLRADGTYRGIEFTNGGLNAAIQEIIASGRNFSPGQRYLHIASAKTTSWESLFHLLLALEAGMTTIIESNSSISALVGDIKTTKPTHILAPANLWLGAVSSPEWKRADLSCLVLPIIGGGALSPHEEECLQKALYAKGFKGKLGTGYGICEFGPIAAAGAYGCHKDGCAGIPLPRVRLAAFDPVTNEERPYYERGELRVISPCRLGQYYRDPEATKALFYTDPVGQVWGHTGDMGYLDQEGGVFVLGRMDNCYCAPDGRRYYLFDAEHIILQDEAVAFCRVVDIPLEGQAVPVAHLVLKQGCALSAEAVISRVEDLCRSQMDPYAVPRGYKLHRQLPLAFNREAQERALKALRTGFLNPEGEEIWI